MRRARASRTIWVLSLHDCTGFGRETFAGRRFWNRVQYASRFPEAGQRALLDWIGPAYPSRRVRTQ